MKDGIAFDAPLRQASVWTFTPTPPRNESEAPLHYDVQRTSTSGRYLEGDVTITIPPGGQMDETFVLAERFVPRQAHGQGPAELDVGTADSHLPTA